MFTSIRSEVAPSPPRTSATSDRTRSTLDFAGTGAIEVAAIGIGLSFGNRCHLTRQVTKEPAFASEGRRSHRARDGRGTQGGGYRAPGLNRPRPGGPDERPQEHPNRSRKHLCEVFDGSPAQSAVRAVEALEGDLKRLTREDEGQQ